jgi:hypothetical protein
MTQSRLLPFGKSVRDRAVSGILSIVSGRVDGNWHRMLAREVPVRAENGEIIGWAGLTWILAASSA